MKLKSKFLLALACLALSISAAVTSSASATDLTTETGTYPANIVATQDGAALVFSNGIRSISCASVTYSATMAAASTDLTISAAISKCTSNGGIPATITLNGCQLTFTSEAGESTAIKSKMVNCNPSKRIEIEIYSNVANHTSGTVLCTLAIAEAKNSEVTGINATNVKGATIDQNQVTLDVESKNIVVDRLTGTAANCGELEKKSGTITGKLTAQAFEDGGAQSEVGLMVG